MRAQLLPVDGGPDIEIIKDLTLIGRKEGCDLRLDHKSVSKYHCALAKTDGLVVRDLGSTNGTKVNGRRVRRAMLLPNDVLVIAHHAFRVALGPGESPSSSDLTEAISTRELAGLIDSKSDDQPPPPLDDKFTLKINTLPDIYEEKPRG